MCGVGLSDADVGAASAVLLRAGLAPQPCTWLEADRACDIRCAAVDLQVLDVLRAALPSKRDLCLQLLAQRSKRLFLADMDATIVNVECLDELAAECGVGAQVEQITTRAMNGTLDFAAALHARVALLAAAGASVDSVQRVLRERVRLNPGARTLLATLHRRGVRTVLVSGGFDVFVEPVARTLGFNEWRCNRFEVVGERICGVMAPIVGSEAKLAAFHEHCKALSIAPTQAVAVGDGANDIPMLAAAGLGVAWRAKAAVQAVVPCRVDHGPLSTILHFLGVPRGEWQMGSSDSEVLA